MVDLYRNQEVGVKVDVWALGCILYALCFRNHPFADESSLQILNAAYSIPSDSPYHTRMHRLIAALLLPDPAVRPHARDVLAAVQRLRAAEEKAPPPASPALATQTSTHAPSTPSAPPPPPPSTPATAAGGMGPVPSFAASFEGAFADFDSPPSSSSSKAAAANGAAVHAALRVEGGTVALALSIDGGGGGSATAAAGFTAEFGDASFTADFGDAPSAPAAAAPAGDDFGEFSSGGFDVSDAATPIAPPAEEEDDSFGDFSGAASHKPFEMAMD